jgi:DNA-binding transcriptional ArsR family regulator
MNKFRSKGFTTLLFLGAALQAEAALQPNEQMPIEQREKVADGVLCNTQNTLQNAMQLFGAPGPLTETLLEKTRQERQENENFLRQRVAALKKRVELMKGHWNVIVYPNDDEKYLKKKYALATEYIRQFENLRQLELDNLCSDTKKVEHVCSILRCTLSDNSIFSIHCPSQIRVRFSKPSYVLPSLVLSENISSINEKGTEILLEHFKGIYPETGKHIESIMNLFGLPKRLISVAMKKLSDYTRDPIDVLVDTCIDLTLGGEISCYPDYDSLYENWIKLSDNIFTGHDEETSLRWEEKKLLSFIFHHAYTLEKMERQEDFPSLCQVIFKKMTDQMQIEDFLKNVSEKNVKELITKILDVQNFFERRKKFTKLAQDNLTQHFAPRILRAIAKPREADTLTDIRVICRELEQFDPLVELDDEYIDKLIEGLKNVVTFEQNSGRAIASLEGEKSFLLELPGETLEVKAQEMKKFLKKRVNLLYENGIPRSIVLEYLRDVGYVSAIYSNGQQTLRCLAELIPSLAMVAKRPDLIFLLGLTGRGLSLEKFLDIVHIRLGKPLINFDDWSNVKQILRQLENGKLTFPRQPLPLPHQPSSQPAEHAPQRTSAASNQLVSTKGKLAKLLDSLEEEDKYVAQIFREITSEEKTVKEIIVDEKIQSLIATQLENYESILRVLNSCAKIFDTLDTLELPKGFLGWFKKSQWRSDENPSLKKLNLMCPKKMCGC